MTVGPSVLAVLIAIQSVMLLHAAGDTMQASVKGDALAATEELIGNRYPLTIGGLYDSQNQQ